MALGAKALPKFAQILEWKFWGHGITTLAAYFFLGFLSSLLFVLVVLQSGEKLRKAIKKKTLFMQLPTGYTNLTSSKSRSFSAAPEQGSLAQADDDDVLSDYDVISSRTLSRQDSQESIDDEDETDEKGSKMVNNWGLNKPISETDSFCAKKPLCTLNFSILCDQSDVILRLIDSTGRCGRLRVNPISGWFTKWSVTEVARRRGYAAGGVDGEEGNEDEEEACRRGEVDGYDLTDGCSVPSVFRSNQYQDAPGVAMNEEFRFVPRTMPEEFHISCRVLESSRNGGAGGSHCRVNGDHNCPLLGSGQTIVKTSSLSSGGTLKMSIFAQPEVSESSILISLNYLPLAERLCVVIMKVKDLKLRDGEEMPHCVYVKVELYRKDQRLKKKKTSTKYNTCNPVFNDMLGFDLMREDLKDVKLKILVVQRLKESTQHSEHSRKPSSSVIKNGEGKTYDYYVFGMCSFGSRKCSPSERDHYDQMLKSPRVPVAKWHLLKMTTF